MLKQGELHNMKLIRAKNYTKRWNDLTPEERKQREAEIRKRIEHTQLDKSVYVSDSLEDIMVELLVNPNDIQSIRELSNAGLYRRIERFRFLHEYLLAELSVLYEIARCRQHGDEYDFFKADFSEPTPYMKLLWAIDDWLDKYYCGEDRVPSMSEMLNNVPAEYQEFLEQYNNNKEDLK